MRVVARILLVIVMVIGVVLVVAGTATLVGADGWTEQIDNIDFGFDIDSGALSEAGYVGIAIGLILIAASVITNLIPADYIIWSS